MAYNYKDEKENEAKQLSNNISKLENEIEILKNKYDKIISNTTQQIEELNGTILITADHGNCEHMWDSNSKSVHTAHTTNLVPFIFFFF